MLLGLATRVQLFWSGLRYRIAGESGAVSTEYVLLLIFVAAVIVGAATAFGIALNHKYEDSTCRAFVTSCP